MPSADACAGQVEHTLSFVEATRLILTEYGHLNDEEFDELLASVQDELVDCPSEAIGYLYARLGYWWVVKE